MAQAPAFGPDGAMGGLETRLPMALGLLVEAMSLLGHDGDGVRRLLDRTMALLGDDDADEEHPAIARLAGLAPWRAQRAIVFVEQRLSTNIRAAELARDARLSRSYFSRSFKMTFGVAPNIYVLRRRVALAQEMMRTTDEPLCQVSAACGFSDQAHFSRVFRRFIGTSPRAWRRAQGCGGRTAGLDPDQVAELVEDPSGLRQGWYGRLAMEVAA